VFDIADDRRDDGTTMSQAPGRGAVPPPPPRSPAYPPPSPREPGQGYEPGGYETGGYETGGYDTGGYSSGGQQGGGYGRSGSGFDGYSTGGYDDPARGGSGYNDPGHNGSGYNGSSYSGSSYSDPGFGGSGYNGSSYSDPGFGGSSYNGAGYSGSSYSDPGFGGSGPGGSSDNGSGYGGSAWGDPGYNSAAYDPAFGSSGRGDPGYGGSGFGGTDTTGRNGLSGPGYGAPPATGNHGGWSGQDEPARTTAMSVPVGPTGMAEGVGLPTPRESASPPQQDASDMVAIIRSSFEAIASRTDEMTQLFYGWLFRIAPETRELFPVTMELQRTRLLRALIHVVQMVDRPDELSVFLRQLGRDHRKFGVIGEHYDRVGEALIGAIKEISGRGWTPEIERAWVGAYAIVSQAMREAADAERGPAVWMARVMEHRRVAPDLAVIRVQTSQPVPYLAGQYVSVETPQRPRMWRSLTPANAPGPDCVMEFHVHTVPGGWVSRAIVSHARVGDVWRIGPPMGQMTLDPRSRADLLMVAGGTGLAPARSLIEQLMVDGSDRKVALFVGGRTWDALYDIDTLRRMAQDNPWLTVVPVIEEDGRRYGAETGTLGEVVARYGAWADRQVVVAGSPPMVRSTVSAMLDAGTPFMQIHYDPYHTD
jgi:NAD(P)H-flavin reductase